MRDNRIHATKNNNNNNNSISNSISKSGEAPQVQLEFESKSCQQKGVCEPVMNNMPCQQKGNCDPVMYIIIQNNFQTPKITQRTDNENKNFCGRATADRRYILEDTKLLRQENSKQKLEV